MAKKKPPRFIKKGNTYYHVGYVVKAIVLPNGKVKKKISRPYTKLGNDYHKAILKWGEVESNLNVVSGTFSSLAKKYIEDVLPEKAESTQKNQKYQIDRLKKVFGKVQLNDIEPFHVAEYLDTKKEKIAANRDIQLMSAMFSKAIRWGWCKNNPTKDVQRNPEGNRDRYITDEEFTLLRKMADDEMRCIIDIAYSTGIRISDIRNIRRRRPSKEIISAQAKSLDIKFAYLADDHLYVEHVKTGYKQEFILAGFLEDAISRAKKIEKKVLSEYLFSTRQGKPHTKSGFDSKWQRFRAKTGLIDIHFHDIRAKAGTDAKRQGMDYQAFLGHTSQAQSDEYIKRREVERICPLNWTDSANSAK